MSVRYHLVNNTLMSPNIEQMDAQLRAYCSEHICLKRLGIPKDVTCERTDAYCYPPSEGHDWYRYRIIGLDSEGNVYTAWILALDFDQQLEEMMISVKPKEET